MGKEEISKAEHGDVIKYKNDYGGHNYLVVQNVENGMVNGQIASPIGVNGVTIDELVKKKQFFLEKRKNRSFILNLILKGMYFSSSSSSIQNLTSAIWYK